jgi:uncharacterized protein DUF6883
VRLPNAWRAIIEERKVRDYLLSRSHPVGRFKAAQLARAGFEQTDWRALVTQLRRLAVRGTAIRGESTAYGQKYTVSGTLKRSGREGIRVLTVWIVPAPGRPPRLVTLLPRKK